MYTDVGSKFYQEARRLRAEAVANFFKSGTSKIKNKLSLKENIK